MKRTTTRGGKIAMRHALNLVVESLELRRMLSYDLTSTIIDTEDGGAHQTFGAGIAVNGNLALVSSPGEFGATTPDGGETFEEFNTTEGRVSLVDTTTGEILQTFHNPAGAEVDDTGFGAAVAWVDGKIAISAPNSVAVYIYDDYADDIPDRTYNYGSDPFVVFGTQLVEHGDDLLVTVLQEPGTGASNNGSIVRFDLDSPSEFPAQTIFNPFGAGITNDQFGTHLASDGTNIFAYYKTLGSEPFTNTGHVVAMDSDGNAIHKYDGLDGDNQFGWSLATVGGNIIIGAPQQNAAYLLDLDGNELAQYDFPAGRDQSQPGSFALALAVNGDKVMVADPFSEQFFDPTPEIPFEHTIQFGAAHVYDLDSGDYLTTIENPEPDMAPDGDQSDTGPGFALCVAPLPDGKWLIASPWNDNANGVDAGAVYVYSPAVITPTNNAPEAGAITGDSSGVRQQTLNFSSSFSDADLSDSHTVTWDFGDGNSTSGSAAQGSVSASHAYAATGTYTVTMTVDDGTDTDSSTFEVSVTGTGVQGGVFYVGGSNGNDSVTITKSSSGTYSVTTADGTQTYSGGRVVIYGGDGADTINVASSVSIPVEIHGGKGNDSLRGGGGNDIIIGDEGDDLIAGAQGRDLMIGGTGSDRIAGDVEDDILISGTTVHDNNSTALGNIMTVWTSGTSFSARVAALKAGPLTPDTDVFDDGVADILTGGSGEDWFLFNVDGAVPDSITDLSHKDFADDLDFIVS